MGKGEIKSFLRGSQKADAKVLTYWRNSPADEKEQEETRAEVKGEGL